MGLWGNSMRYETLRPASDAGLGARARIGMMVLKTDQTLEFEAAQIMGKVDGVALHHARLYNDFEINRETLMAMKPRLAETAKLLPVEWKFKSIGFGCTSASMVIGEAAVEREIRSVHPDARVTNPFTAGITGLVALDCKRIAVLTPYVRAVNDGVAAALQQRGLEVTAFASWEEPDDDKAGKISVAEITRAAIAIAAADDVDGVFVSCTSLRTVEAIPTMEAACGKPVTASNHAMVWHMLRLAGISEPIGGLGRLYERDIAAASRSAAAE